MVSLKNLGTKKSLVGVILSLLLMTLIAGWAVASPAPTLADGVELAKGPYVQRVTTTSAVVRWEAGDGVAASFEYGTTSQYGQNALVSRTGNLQERVQLSGLKPYTRYYYRVLGQDGEPIASASFKTLAGPEHGKISFVAWGDNRTNHGIHGQLANLIAGARPDFVLNVGDLVESGRRQADWDTFFVLERELLARAPLFSAIGNHEEDSPLYFSLFSLPGNERWYSFDSGPAHLVALDVVFSDFGPGSPQYAWLEKDLAETDRPWKVVFLHYPPYSFTPFRGGVDSVKQALTPLFEKYDVQLVFSGHNHHYQRNVVNGVTYVVTGGGGAPLHPVSTSRWTAYGEETYQFVKLSIDNGILEASSVRLNGTEFDRFSLALPTEEVSGGVAVSDAVAGSEGRPQELWDFHRSLLVPGGVGGIVFALAFVGVRRSRYGKSSGTGELSDAQGKANS